MSQDLPSGCGEKPVASVHIMGLLSKNSGDVGMARREYFYCHKRKTDNKKDSVQEDRELKETCFSIFPT